MIRFLPTAESLHRQKIWFRDEPVERASIFPMFDQNGQIKQLMVILPSIDEICLIPWNPGLVKLGFWGTRRLMLNLEELKSHNQFSTVSLRNLWTYDPWWTLSKNRFWRNREIEQLVQTNCVNKFEEKVAAVYYERDLSRLRKIMIEQASFSFSYRSATLEEMTLRPGLSLPPLKNGAQKSPFSSQWQLEPVWDDWGKMKTFCPDWSSNHS